MAFRRFRLIERNLVKMFLVFGLWAIEDGDFFSLITICDKTEFDGI